TTVERLDLATGVLSTIAGPEQGWKGLNDVAVDVANQIAYVVDGGIEFLGSQGIAGDHRVRAIDLVSGAVADLAGRSDHEGVRLGALPGALNRPAGIAILPSGELVISDEAEDLVVRLR